MSDSAATSSEDGNVDDAAGRSSVQATTPSPSSDSRAASTPWFVVGLPWNEAAPWINAESDDPQGGEFVCDLAWPHDTPENVERTEANAALIVRAVNEFDALLAIETMVREALDADLPLADVFVRVAKSHLAAIDEVRRG